MWARSCRARCSTTPIPTRFRRWRERGHLGVEMEAAILYTIAAIRGVEALTILTVSDVIEGEESTRISDDELKRGVDDMMALACRVATAAPATRPGEGS